MSLPAFTQEDIELVQGRYGRELANLTKKYAVPLFWPIGPTVGGMDDELINGTTFFLDCGLGAFGVTAGHVFDRHAEYASRGILCQIGKKHFDLRTRLIARGRRLDIATFRVKSDEISGTGAWVRKEPSWPPPSPKENDVVLYAGFPGNVRRIDAPGKLNFGTYYGSALISSVNDERISCLFPDREDLLKLPGWTTPEPGCDTGGMSGGPMLFLRGGTLITWGLAGVICEAAYDAVEMVQAVRADAINPDGSLNEPWRPPEPPRRE